MADVEYALEFFLEGGFVGKCGVAPIERVTRGRLQAALPYPVVRWAHVGRVIEARSDRVERLLEAIRVRTFGLGQRLEPVGDFGKAFFTCLLGHARIHVAVFVRFASNGGLEVRPGLANRQPSRRITYGFEVLEVTVCMAGFAFGRRTEYR